MKEWYAGSLVRLEFGPSPQGEGYAVQSVAGAKLVATDSPSATEGAALIFELGPEAQAAATRHLPRRHALSPSASSCCALSVSSGAVSLQPGSEAQTQRSPSERPQATPPPPHVNRAPRGTGTHAHCPSSLKPLPRHTSSP